MDWKKAQGGKRGFADTRRRLRRDSQANFHAKAQRSQGEEKKEERSCYFTLCLLTRTLRAWRALRLGEKKMRIIRAEGAGGMGGKRGEGSSAAGEKTFNRFR